MLNDVILMKGTVNDNSLWFAFDSAAETSLLDYRRSKKLIPDIADSGREFYHYWLRTLFAMPAHFAGKRTWIKFHGINYRCAIWLNGKKLGEMAGMFNDMSFDITGIKGNPQALQSIDELVVEAGPLGQATTRVKRVTGARAYIHEYTPDPITSDSKWTSEFIAEREHTFTGLQSVVKYWFRVTAIGTNKQKVYSPTVSRVVQ